MSIPCPLTTAGTARRTSAIKDMHENDARKNSRWLTLPLERWPDEEINAEMPNITYSFRDSLSPVPPH